MLMLNADNVGQQYLAEAFGPDNPLNGDEPVILSVGRDGSIMGACAYQNYRGTSIEMSVAGFGPWLSPGNIAGFLSYPFNQLGVNRITVFTRRTNTRCIKLVEGLGFQHEGTLRGSTPDGADLLMFGLLRDEAARWLKLSLRTKWMKNDGQEIPKCAPAP